MSEKATESFYSALIMLGHMPRGNALAFSIDENTDVSVWCRKRQGILVYTVGYWKIDDTCASLLGSRDNMDIDCAVATLLLYGVSTYRVPHIVSKDMLDTLHSYRGRIDIDPQYTDTFISANGGEAI